MGYQSNFSCNWVNFRSVLNCSCSGDCVGKFDTCSTSFHLETSCWWFEKIVLVLYDFIIFIRHRFSCSYSFGIVCPILELLSWWSYRSWIKAVNSQGFWFVYSLTAVALIALSFWLPTKRMSSNTLTNHGGLKVLPPSILLRKCCPKAEASFMKRNSNHRHATRVIAATHHHFKLVKGLSNQRGDLKHNISMGLLIITTLLILIGDIGRCIVVFQARQSRHASQAANIWFMYVCWGFSKSLSMHFISLVEWILDFTVQMCYLQQLDLLLPLNKLTTHLLMKKKMGSIETDQKHMGNSVEEQNTDMPHQIVTQHMVAKIKSWHLMTTKMIISKILILKNGTLVEPKKSV